MCWCKPEIRTPNCGSMQCLSAAIKAERNRIADALDEEANPDAYSYDVKFALRSFAERLRKGEV